MIYLFGTYTLSCVGVFVMMFYSRKKNKKCYTHKDLIVIFYPVINSYVIIKTLKG